MASGDGGSSRKKKAMQTAALLAGAAGLFLFIMGVKRRYRLDEEFELDAMPPRPRRSAEKSDAQRDGEAAAIE
jgi:hypothetical protein